MQDLDYRVVVVGEVSSGKSSFINSLMGKYVCPTSILRKTIVTSSHSLITNVKKNTIIDMTDEKTEMIELVDYPGFNDANKNTFLQKFLEEITNYNHVLWITTAEKCLMNEAEKSILYSICDQISLTTKLINLTVVVNKSDMNDAVRNTFRFEKNEYEMLYDNMCNILERDHSFVRVFKHSSYHTILDKMGSATFELEGQYVDEFNRTIRAKHGPQTNIFKKGDVINYSEFINNNDLQNITVPNLIEPYLFATARSNRTESFGKTLNSKISPGLREELEFLYDVLIHQFPEYPNSYDSPTFDTTEILEKIKKRCISMKLETKSRNPSIYKYLEEKRLNFSSILSRVLDRQKNQIDFMNILAELMGEILYYVAGKSLFCGLNFRNSGKAEFLHFLLQMDQMTKVYYDEEDYFQILDNVKTESQVVQFTRYDPASGTFVPKTVNRFIISGGELQLNSRLWHKLLKVEGRFSIFKKIMDSISTNSLVLSNEKRNQHVSVAPNRLNIIQKKLNWKTYKNELDKLPKFIYKNLKFWYFNLLQVYLPSLFNPKFLDYPVDNDCTKNSRDSVLPDFSNFYDKTR